MSPTRIMARRPRSPFGAIVVLTALFGLAVPVVTTRGPADAAGPVSFTILHTNDFHGNLEPAGSNPGAARAAPVTVPPGLNAGDQYRLAFVTDGRRDGTSNDIAVYNTFVTEQANLSAELAALNTTWMAVGSTFAASGQASLVDALVNTNTNPAVDSGYPIYRLDGTRVADNNADLWDGSIDAPIQVDQYGDTLNCSTESNCWVATGTETSGFGEINRQLGNIIGRDGFGPTGLANQTGASWVNDGAYDFRLQDRFYAISDVLTAPAVKSVLNAELANTAIFGQTYDPGATCPNPAECAAGVFSFTATFCNVSSPDATLTDLTSRTRSLSSHASLVSRDRDGSPVPGGAGSEQDFLNGTLTPQAPQDCEDITYEIGLSARQRFSFYVDMFGSILPNTVTVPTDGTPVGVCGWPANLIATSTGDPGVLIGVFQARVTAIDPPPTQGYQTTGVPFGCGESSDTAVPLYDTPQSSLTLTYECDCP